MQACTLGTGLHLHTLASLLVARCGARHAAIQADLALTMARLDGDPSKQGCIACMAVQDHGLEPTAQALAIGYPIQRLSRLSLPLEPLSVDVPQGNATRYQYPAYSSIQLLRPSVACHNTDLHLCQEMTPRRLQHTVGTGCCNRNRGSVDTARGSCCSTPCQRL